MRIKIASVAVLMALVAAGVVAGLASSHQSSIRSGNRTPAWFAAIAKSYGNNPKITPHTNFAQLAFGGLPRTHSRRGGRGR